jgi:hypothetical protein
MKSGQQRYRCVIALAAAALLIGPNISQADDAAANPSFSSSMDVFSLTPSAQFGTLRQYQPATPINVTIYNRQVSTPQSAMTYQPSQTTSLPAVSPPVTLQNIALNNIPAGGSGSLQLALSTNQPGSNVSTIYNIHFSSDTGPAPNHDQLNIFAFATVLPAGDFNNDKSVDPRDYVLWRKTQGSTVAPWTLGDSNGDSVVNDSDYVNFRKNFGMVLPGNDSTLDGSSPLETAGVPEPGSAFLAIIGLGAARLFARTRSRRRRGLI